MVANAVSKPVYSGQWYQNQKQTAKQCITYIIVHSGLSKNSVQQTKSQREWVKWKQIKRVYVVYTHLQPMFADAVF